MKTIQKPMSVFIAVLLILSSAIVMPLTVSAASAPAFTINSVTNLTTTDAKISARITNPARTTITRVGFQLGTSSGNLSTNKYDTVSMTSSYVDASYLMSKYKVSLKANTTYYYKFYMITGGKTYYSAVKNFKTKANASVPSPVFTVNSASGVSQSNATISAKITNPAGTIISRVGFVLGTSTDNLSTNKYDNVSMNSSYVNASYLMSKYGVSLKAGTTYYYKFYIITGGKTYYSGVNSFKTAAAQTETKPQFTKKASSGVTNNDARITTTITTIKGKTTEVGFQLGTASKSYNVKKYDKVNMTSTTLNAGFTMSKYGVTLKANTKYYFRFYMVVNGKTYNSGECNLTTLPDPSTKPLFTKKTATDISDNNARITTTITTIKGKTTEVGFQIGTASKSYSYKKCDKVNMTSTTLNAGFTMSKYGVKLKAKTKYYYRFYMVVNGKTYYSGECSFITDTIRTTNTQIYFPLPHNQVWSASTYQGHGSSFGAAYSSVDIVLKNGKSAEGAAVYSAAAGKVIYYDPNNGQIVIEHNVKLITTNNKTYTKWYTIYAHMKNIKVKVGNTVKRGQQIGQVSSVGKATGPHLHFNIISGNGNTAWNSNDKKKAISPYYVYGFVQANGKDNSICVCDRQGPAVTATLINWKPTGV